MIFDIFIVETLAVVIGALITLEIGKIPSAFGPMRDFMLAVGPKTIRRAYIS